MSLLHRLEMGIHLVSILIINLWIALTVPVMVSASIGTITEQINQPAQIKRSTQSLEGKKGSGVEMMDAIRTAQGKIGIVFDDQTKVQVTDNSRLVIDEFVYDPKSSTGGKLAMKVALGTVRYASGAIAKRNPQAVAITTPTATIGVRGTDFTASVDELGRSTIILLPSCPRGWISIERDCKVGEISVETSEGIVVMNQAFQATRVETKETKPKSPVILNLSEDAIHNMILFAPPQELQDKKDARLNLNKGALDIDFLASTGLVNAFDQSNKEIQKMYVNKLEQNSLDQDFLQNILDQINEQLAAKADALARTKGGLLPDYVKSSGVVVAIDEPSVELCRNDGSNIQCIQTPTNQNSTITQIQGSVEITNRVNQGGSTTITIRQSN